MVDESWNAMSAGDKADWLRGWLAEIDILEMRKKITELSLSRLILRDFVARLTSYVATLRDEDDPERILKDMFEFGDSRMMLPGARG